MEEIPLFLFCVAVYFIVYVTEYCCLCGLDSLGLRVIHADLVVILVRRIEGVVVVDEICDPIDDDLASVDLLIVIAVVL